MVYGMEFPSLIIETSSASTSAGLCLADRRIFAVEKEAAISHSEQLAPVLRDLFLKANIPSSDLKSIIVAAGPGSFTGVRIGLSFAAGLCAVSKAGLFPLSSLEMLQIASSGFERVDEPERVFLRDARRSEFFCRFWKEGGWIEEIISEASLFERFVTDREVELLSDEASLLDRIPSLEIVGSPVEALLGKILESPEAAENMFGSSSNLARAEDFLELKPNYIRSVSAKTLAERAL